MELDNKQELRTEPLPEHLKDDYKAVLIREVAYLFTSFFLRLLF